MKVRETIASLVDDWERIDAGQRRDARRGEGWASMRAFSRRRTLSAVAVAVGRSSVASAAGVGVRPEIPAADTRLDALLAARSALKRAYAVQHSAELQTEQLRELARLEAERRAASRQA